MTAIHRPPCGTLSGYIRAASYERGHRQQHREKVLGNTRIR